MAHYHWRELFPPHIWQRGQNYYRDGNILDIRFHGNCVTAEIEGTETYHVSVTLDERTNRVEDFSCDCPYGEDGTPCKHLAALLCALEDTNGKSSKIETDPAFEQVVELLTAEQMRQLLVRFAQEDSFVWEKILLAATNQLPRSQKHQWQRCIAVYQDFLHQAMARASNRKAYWSVIQVLKKLKKYPEGNAAAQIIAGQWKQAYPRRTSMLDELRNAGF